MNQQLNQAGRLPRRLASIVAASLLCAAMQSAGMPQALAASKARSAAAAPTEAARGGPLAPCSGIAVAPPTDVTLGKSSLVKLPAPVVRLVVGGIGAGSAGKPQEDAPKEPSSQQQLRGATDSMKTGVADVDVMLLSPTELYVLGKRVGSMNLIVQDRDNRCTVMDVTVTMDSGTLQAKLAQLMPEEKNIRIAAAQDSLIVSGEVADAVKVERAMTLAAAYAPDKRLVNLLRASAAQQVMLEVKVAEVSKTLLDKLGAAVATTSGGSGWQYSLLSNFLTDGTGLLEAFKVNKGRWQLNGEKDDGVVRVLAEPNLMAISGQQASFLSGGKIFIPVAQTNNGGIGGTTITLEEKEFGVGVKFVPTVLEGDRINLKVASEVSELSQTGSPFTTIGGVTAILPSMTTRRADTSVQLRDGQSFAIAGLIKNNLSESMKRFPGLGEIPVLGALFRSAEFQRDMTELLFIITPRLVKPLPANYALPTDHLKEPTRSEFLLGGKLEGSRESEPKKPSAPVSDAGKDRATPAQASAAQPSAPADETPVATPQPVSNEQPTVLVPDRRATAPAVPAVPLRTAATVASGEPGGVVQ